MNFRDELARIIASDPRYTIDAYAFILEALNHARTQKLKAKGRDRDRALVATRSSTGLVALANPRSRVVRAT